MSKIGPTGPLGAGVAEGRGVSRAKLDRRGRREIGRALEAMYDDVIKEGVPRRFLQLLEGLGGRAGDNPDPPSA